MASPPGIPSRFRAMGAASRFSLSMIPDEVDTGLARFSGAEQPTKKVARISGRASVPASLFKNARIKFRPLCGTERHYWLMTTVDGAGHWSMSADDATAD